MRSPDHLMITSTKKTERSYTTICYCRTVVSSTTSCNEGSLCQHLDLTMVHATRVIKDQLVGILDDMDWPGLKDVLEVLQAIAIVVRDQLVEVGPSHPQQTSS